MPEFIRNTHSAAHLDRCTFCALTNSLAQETPYHLFWNPVQAHTVVVNQATQPERLFFLCSHQSHIFWNAELARKKSCFLEVWTVSSPLKSQSHSTQESKDTVVFLHNYHRPVQTAFPLSEVFKGSRYYTLLWSQNLIRPKLVKLTVLFPLRPRRTKVSVFSVLLLIRQKKAFASCDYTDNMFSVFCNWDQSDQRFQHIYMDAK